MLVKDRITIWNNVSTIRRCLWSLIFAVAFPCDYAASQFSEYKPLKPFVHTILPSSPTATYPASKYGKSSLEIRSALLPLAESFANSIIPLRSEVGRQSLGTIISADGLIVGKRSEFSTRNVSCFIDEKEVEGLIIASHSELDLALIRVQQRLSSPIEIPPLYELSRPGKFVVSITGDSTQPVFGTVSVQPQKFQVKPPECKDCVDLGITISGIRQTKTVQVQDKLTNLSGFEVTRVYPRTPGEKCGLLTKDLLCLVNGKAFANSTELKRLGNQLKVGQTLELVLIREGKLETFNTIINRLSPRILHDRWGGGPFSEKRFGFSEVIVHDSVILPEHCGGPLVDLQGKVLGINIARSMRVASFSIGIDRVVDFVQRARPQTTLNFSPNKSDQRLK